MNIKNIPSELVAKYMVPPGNPNNQDPHQYYHVCTKSHKNEETLQKEFVKQNASYPGIHVAVYHLHEVRTPKPQEYIVTSAKDLLKAANKNATTT